MTEKLYYDDPYLREFTAEIIQKEKIDKWWRIQLSHTAFYPEGGGQPGDKGTLNEIPVTHVQKEEDQIYHYMDELPESSTVSGVIDWNYRFDYMQQHTGQHILSAVLKRVLGASTVAVHQADDYTSIEIDLSEISTENLELIEDAANGLVCANHPVYSYLNGEIPVSLFPLRRETKRTENVRLLQIGGDSLEGSSVKNLEKASLMLSGDFNVFTGGLKDLAACGGVHLCRTGEVGLIKYKGQEKVRGRLRLFWLIGNRAYRDYREKTEISDRMSEALSVPLKGILREFDRFLSSLGEEKKRNSDLLKEMAFLKAEEIRNENLEGKKSFVLHEADSAYFKKIIITLSSFRHVSLCVLNVKGEEGQWAVVSTGEEEFDFNRFRSDLLPLIQGKGGGKSPLWQGKLGNCSALEEFQKQFSLSLT